MNDPLNILNKTYTLSDNDILFLGCSYTRGIGLDAKEHRYSNILSDYYNKNQVNLAEQALDNFSCFNYFSTINFADPGTIVILQLTQLSRIRHYDEINNKPVGVLLANSSYYKTSHLLEVYHDKFLIYETINRLHLIVNYCRAKKIKLAIWSITRFFNEYLDTVFEEYLNEFPEYVFLDNRLGTPTTYRVDNGNDGTTVLGTGHPGPESNKLIAKKLIEHIDNLYFK